MKYNKLKLRIKSKTKMDMVIISRIKILFGLPVFLFMHQFAYATDSLDQKMTDFQSRLNQIQSKLNGSIISVSGKNYNFSYSSPCTGMQSQFYIGSISKQITAYILLKSLQEQHQNIELKILLEQKLPAIFPNSALLKQINKAWLKEITLLDLLTHRSGLSDYIRYYESSLKKPEMLNAPIDPIDILQVVKFNPSKPFHYSNTNYFLLGKLVEEIQHESYGQIFERLVKKPAQMKSSQAPTQDNYHAIKKLAQYKELRPNQNNEIFIDFANVGGAGGIISTSEDLLKWNEYFYHKSDVKLKRAMLINYFTNEDGEGENLGLSTNNTNIGELIGFQGSLDSYFSFLGFYPEHNLSIVILSNNSEDYELLLNSFNTVFGK